jgi:hypothetical protein
MAVRHAVRHAVRIVLRHAVVPLCVVIVNKLWA